MTPQRTTPDGRYTIGNTFCHRRWRGLVDKRFGGDEALAKAWLTPFGFHTYARLALEDASSTYKLNFSTYQHSGSPEEFMAEFKFALADVLALQF